MTSVWQLLRDDIILHEQKAEALDLCMYLNHDAEEIRISSIANVDLQNDSLGLGFSISNLAILLN